MKQAFGACLFAVLLVILDELGHHFLHTAGNHIVGNLVNGCFGVGVDGNDNAAFLHTCHMLDGTADTAGNIYLRTHGYTGLTDLQCVFAIAGIDSRTAGPTSP